MKLYLSDASPYARLVRVLLIETERAEQTELVYVDPWASPAELLAVNPAAKVPALVLDDGTCLVESTCVADYLIHHSGQVALPGLNPERADERLRILGLARAVVDCAFGSVVQQRFAVGSPLSQRWRDALPRLAASLEALAAPPAPQATVDLADLTLAVAFEYVDFRLSETGWRTIAPRLADRVAILGQRPSLKATRPR